MNVYKIKYKYAYDNNENLIDIVNLNKENKNNEYLCLSCSKILILKLGKIKQHHFAHKVIGVCSGETYLHLLGKKVFQEEYKQCLEEQKPFIIENIINRTCISCKKIDGISCHLKQEIKQFDLTEYFKKLTIEKRDHEFIPDILLESNKSEKIYIEIAVKHKAEEKKLKSNIRIIEYRINKESDIELIKDHYIPLFSENIKIYNFKEQHKEREYYNFRTCSKVFTSFILYKSGKSIVKHYNISEYKQHFSKCKHLIIYSKLIKDDLDEHFIDDFYRQNIVEAFEKGIKFKNCYLCRYHALGREDAIFCKFLKFNCGSSYAIDCKYFKADKNVYKEYLHGWS